jgi:hypothetical protein
VLRGLLVVEELRQRSAVGERAPEVRVRGDGGVAVAAQLELADHQLVEQAHHIGAGADQVIGISEGALQRAGAAELLAALQHENRAAAAREVGRGG